MSDQNEIYIAQSFNSKSVRQRCARLLLVKLLQLYSYQSMMVDQNQPQSPHTRLLNDTTFNYLSTDKSRMRFMFAVRDYMDYVRSNPQEREDYDEVKEKETSVRFVQLVSSSVGWPLARQMVPEFRLPPYVK